MCTVLSAIAEFVGTGAVVIVVECASVKKREPTVTVGAVCKGAKCSDARMKVELAGCCKLASETLRSSAACDEPNCDKEFDLCPKDETHQTVAENANQMKQ